MTDGSAYDVITSRDGRFGLGVIEFEGQYSSVANPYFQAGGIPGLERSPIVQVQAKLGAPRYTAAAEHFSKAIAFLTGPSHDLANSAKEAILAVESLAMLVTRRTKGTLGDCIKDLRTRGNVPAPLDRVFEALLAFLCALRYARQHEP